MGISHNLPNKPRGTVGGYLGSYLNQVDEKGRVTLPAAFRKGAQAGASFVLIHAHKSEALTLYPDFNWGDVQERMRNLALSHPEKRHALLSLTANAQEVIPDKQGRILIAERLRLQVGITDDVRLVGALDRIELWNPESFSRAVDDADGDVSEIAAGLFV